MEDAVRILIADDSPQIRAQLKSGLEAKDFIKVVGVAENGLEAFEKIRDLMPDLVILDLIMPIIDGIGILQKLSELPPPIPKVIVISAIGHEDVIQEVSEYGADYYMVKPVGVDVLSQRIYDLMKKPDRKNNSQGIALSPKSGALMSVDEEITSIFLTIGIPAHIKGYHFLRQAVKLVIDSPDMINRITKELYPAVAKHFDTSPSKVERAIRHAIEVAWTRGKIEKINQIFGYNIYNKRDKPTNGEFIALIADKLSLQLKTIDAGNS